MKKAIVKLKSLSPYSQSRYHGTPKLEKETADAYEQRTWIEKGHYTDKGQMFIPPMSLKFCLAAAAKERGLQIPGRGKKTYSSAFSNGIMILEPVLLKHFKKDIKPNWIHANADGIRGSGKRVMRAFPVVDEWEGTATFEVLNDSITKEVFTEHLTEAGRYIGIGQFRPQNGGYFGRFEVVSIKWEEA